MKWLDEIKDKEVFDYSSYDAMIFEDGFNSATKAISEKLRDINAAYNHSNGCAEFYCRECDCWKAELKEIGLV